MAETDPRRLALDVLLAVEERAAFADAALARALERCALTAADRRLATRIVYGTLAWQLTLDTSLNACADRPLQKMHAVVRTLLRLSLYQIAFLERVPDYAVVDAAVTLCKERAPRAAGLVNAVLRRAARLPDVRPAAGSDPSSLAVAYSHPRWLVEMWLCEIGAEETLLLMAANNEPNPSVVRALCSRDDAMSVLLESGRQASAARYAPDALVVDTPVEIEGVVLSQSEASQLVVLLCGVEPGQRVLDACAAPGGKSAYLARLVGPEGRVTAVDPGPNGSARIERTLSKAGVANVDVLEVPLADVRGPADYDVVLVDAPCSGLGTLRQHPEIRWRRRLDDVHRLAKQQCALLETGAELVRPGGRLIYSTCTIAHAENDAVVEAVLATRSDLRAEGVGGLHPALAGLVGNDGRLRTFPHRHGLDGFYAARMRRT